LMNNAKPPFDDVRARQAVAYAINKDVINERVYDELATAHCDHLPERLRT